MSEDREPFERDDFSEPPPFFPRELGRGGFAGSPVTVRIAATYSTEAHDTVQRFVQLQDDEGRDLTISIGPFEAMAISLVLEGTTLDRPMTHDLLKMAIERMGGSVDRVLIDDLWNATYYAKLYIKTKTAEFEVDSRPSDAIALAVRFGCPIYVLDSILDAAQMDDE
jgi:bifunctional DNase/RNase